MGLEESLKAFDSENEGAVEAKQQFPPRILLDEKIGNFVDGTVTRVRKGDYKGKATLSYTIKVNETNARLYRTSDRVDPNTGDKLKDFVELPADGLVELRANSDLMKKAPQPVEGQRVHITFIEKKKLGNAPKASSLYRMKLGKIAAGPTALADSEI